MVRTQATGVAAGSQRPAAGDATQHWDVITAASPVYSILCGALAVPMLLASSNSWNAWVRAINRPPPPPSVSGWDRVVGTPLTHWKEEAVISHRSWRRLGFLTVVDIVEVMTITYAGAFSSLCIDNIRSPRMEQPESQMPVLNLSSELWGYALGTVLTYPLSVLTWQIHTNHWRGWRNLLPFTALGRQQWQALPARIAATLAVNVLSIRVGEELAKRTGISSQLMGWLAADLANNKEENNYFDESEEDQSTASVILRRARLWGTSVLSNVASNLVLVALQTPSVIVFHRMLAEPDRFGSVLACVKHIWTQEGLGGFYRDLPLFGILCLITCAI